MLEGTTPVQADAVADPTTCDRCGASLERGWSERWRDNKRIEALCFGCDDAERLRAYLNTKVITSKLMIRAAIEAVHREYGKGSPNEDAARALAEVHASTERIKVTVKDFERRVWFGGLQALVRAATHRGFRAAFGATGSEFDVLAYSLAGRTMITIESADESHSITVITADDSAEPVMGIQGISATEVQAISLLTAACAAHEDGMRFERDDKVGMM